MMLPGGMNSEALLAWVHNVLIPTLMPGDIVIWDNLRIHEDPAVAAALTAAGACLDFPPPCSPEFNPIEEAWSKMKSLLCVAKARTFGRLLTAWVTRSSRSRQLLAWAGFSAPAMALGDPPH